MLWRDGKLLADDGASAWDLCTGDFTRLLGSTVGSVWVAHSVCADTTGGRRAAGLYTFDGAPSWLFRFPHPAHRCTVPRCASSTAVVRWRSRCSARACWSRCGRRGCDWIMLCFVVCCVVFWAAQRARLLCTRRTQPMPEACWVLRTNACHVPMQTDNRRHPAATTLSPRSA